jgi:hypothetical protein
MPVRAERTRLDLRAVPGGKWHEIVPPGWIERGLSLSAPRVKSGASERLAELPIRSRERASGRRLRSGPAGRADLASAEQRTRARRGVILASAFLREILASER